MLLEEDDGAAEEEVEAREDVAMRAAELDEEAARVNIEATGAREVSALIFFLPSSSKPAFFLFNPSSAVVVVSIFRGRS